MELIVVKHDPTSILALNKYINNNYSHDVGKEPEFLFTFENFYFNRRKRKLSLTIGKDGQVLKCSNGWEISLDMNELAQDTVDHFKRSTDVPGRCSVIIHTHGIACRQLALLPTVRLNGIISDKKYIIVHPPIQEYDEAQLKHIQPSNTASLTEMKDHEKKHKEIITKLQSDLQLCKEGHKIQLTDKEKETRHLKNRLVEKEKEIWQLKDHLQEVERKLLQDKTMELTQEHSQDHIKHEETIDHSDNEGNMDEIMRTKQLHQEIDILRQQKDKLQLEKEDLLQEMDNMQDKRDHIKHEETSDDNEEDVKRKINKHLCQEIEMLRQQNNNLKLEKEDLRQELEIVKREPSLVQDQSTQFNYMTTVNDCLDNVHVGGETVYHIQGNNAQSFNWSKWGLRIYFSKDSVLEASTDTMMTCEVAVKALVGGKFQFPDGSELVSAVYAVSFANKLSKPVKLEMQHCAVLKNDHQCRRLSFVKAPMRQRVPPFEFSPLEGGVFSIDSQYGSITLDHFCLIAIILVVNNIPVGVVWKRLNEDTTEPPETSTSITSQDVHTDADVTEPLNTASTGQDASVPTVSDSAVAHSNEDVELSYAGQFYYSHHGDGSTINRWLVRFIAVKDLNALETYLNEKLPNAEDDQSIQFGFYGNNGVLELVMNHVQDTPNNGWTVRPHTNPLTIRRKQIDKFGRDDGVPSPPSCLITVYATPGPDTAPDLHYCVPLRGVVCDTKEMFINRILDETRARPEPHSHITSDQGSRPSNEVTDTAVNYYEVFRNHYDNLVTAMVTSCSLSNVARGSKSVNLISQSSVDFVNANRLSEPDQCVIRLLREIVEFLRISKNASKKRQAMVDFCKVLRDQDSPLLSEMVSQLSDELGIQTNN